MNGELTLIEKCPSCFGSGKRTPHVATYPDYAVFGRQERSCYRCDGTGRRTMADRIDPTGQDVFVLFGIIAKPGK